MSLAQLFYFKETFRQRVRKWRQACFRTHVARHDTSFGGFANSSFHIPHSTFSKSASRFQLEALEPRLLMSVAPEPGLALQEIAIEPAAAVIQGTTTVQVLTGDSAPSFSGAPSGTFQFLGAPALNNAGQTAFSATVTGATSNSGIFRSSGPGLVTDLARVGDPTPTSAGDTFQGGFGYADLNDAGQAAFVAFVTSDFPGDVGIFRSSGPGGGDGLGANRASRAISGRDAQRTVRFVYRSCPERCGAGRVLCDLRHRHCGDLSQQRARDGWRDVHAVL